VGGGGGGVQLGPLGTAATNRPIVPAPGDYDDREISGMIGRGKSKYSQKTSPSERRVQLPRKSCGSLN
jgi:hypothetical protein